ncbi:MAG: hypothetical protein R3189_04780 [Thiomicrorhabdus chilensis]|uniref:hypothetical protein n=1 Tax=Thiomicrorhabdus chilensis TaxID=63656 RepID=UPI0012FDF561|nr:hypothetical protein [Thiomicrorhabdus chilensis]MDX1347548.1 hypothetical protein [Thiomicrorhabdus chilensis]
MKYKMLLSGVVLGLSAAAFLSGCNMANSADGGSDSAPTNLMEPTASVSIQSALPVADSQGYYEEDAIVTVNASAVGSLGSSVTCSTTLSYNDAVVDTILGCGTKQFQLASGAGAYRIKLTATDANSLVAEDQKFLIAVPQLLANSVYLSADFNFTTSSDVANSFDVFLDATPSTKGEAGDISTYTWQIRLKQDDNDETLVDTVGPTNSPTTNVTVNQDGIYVARLTIVDEGDNTAVTEKMFSVGTGSALVADFSVAVSGAAPVNIDVDASSSTIAAGADHYIWEVYPLDGTSGEVAEEAIYRLTVESATTVLPIAVSGTYLIRLKVIDTLGNEHLIARLVNVT